MSDKMTLKEWSAYLPHKLTIHNEHLYPDHVSTLDGIWGDSAIHSEDKNGYFKEKLGNIKPLLRPILDLTKQITRNGVTFVPLDVIRCMNRFGENLYIQSGVSSENFGKLDWWTEVEDGFTYTEMQAVVDKLLEWHFDVFGLIERGLAIPLKEEAQ